MGLGGGPKKKFCMTPHRNRVTKIFPPPFWGMGNPHDEKKPPVDQKSTAARRTMISTMVPPSKMGVGQRGDGQCPTLNSDELNSKEVEVLWLIPWSTHKKSVIPPIHSVIVILHKKIRPNLQIYVFITMTKNEITVRTHSSLLGKKIQKKQILLYPRPEILNGT